MEGIFTEFENENTLRTYPFAAGCDTSEDSDVISPGIFVDAAIYPVNPSGTVYLSGVSEDGVVSISDDSGVIMSGVPSGNTVELYDTSSLRRHVGTLIASSRDALEEFAWRGGTREYGKTQTAFSSGCVFPVIIDGVRSITVGGEGPVSGASGFENGPSDPVRVSSGILPDGRGTIRFDILPRPEIRNDDSIRRIICVVDGQTPFRIEKIAHNTVMLMLDSVDKGAVCSAAHRENAFEMADTCSCEKKIPTHEELPEAYQLEEVYIPFDESTGRSSENAFYLVVPNVLGYDNPISITLEDGSVSPKTKNVNVVVEGTSVDLPEGEILDDMTSKCVVIQVPGIKGGKE